ncbi:Rieske 2Fe-2S domain-containing protein [Bradyrhizobium mercantei]|uniref:Rieske 2Fe-2S domain-containing protein n=1 Tax=Bradyrhizobium mercantei TaxID=1904807 RepID=UPI00097797F9|nr:Rieske 2Fe-2S domain-containing protein [Bradyrhizobium mercantei]
MTDIDDNARLTLVGPGKPMGKLMRCYWMPILMSWELAEADAPPVRVRLLGEDLVAFRATDGSIGLLDEYCPHRRASLFLGRNEENGLRCVYHGWKFNTEGQCVHQMNEPNSFADKVRTTSYPTAEIGGVVWAYLGPSDKKPPLPKFDWTQVPAAQRTVTKVVQECNWLQALEGGLDSSHFSILHRALRDNPLQEGLEPKKWAIALNGPTRLELEPTDYGYRYFGIRSGKDNSVYVRGYHFVMPFTQLRPPGPGRKQVHGHFWVPMDDHNTMVWNFYADYEGNPLTEKDEEALAGRGNNYGSHVDPKDGFKSIRNRSNDWLIDRAMQKTETFTGIDGVNQQDRAVQESMGLIVDRSKERLGPSDRAVVATRRLLREATEALEKNETPRGVDATYYDLLPAEGVFKQDEDWHAKLIAAMYPKKERDVTM